MIKINLIENEYVDIIKISIQVKCKTCKNIWGVYLNAINEQPPHWDMCKVCADNLLSESRKECKNDY